ncbi:MAG TPA: hypothetical protein VIC59_09605 [Gemmatimonadota bacterium]
MLPLRRIALLALLGPAAAARPLEAQSVLRWDTALHPAGQRDLLLRTISGGNFGLPLGGGDVNGDRRDDVLLCAFNASEAFLFFAPSVNAGQQEALAQPGVVTRISGIQSLGVECAGGDVNGDGFADLVLGAPNVVVSGQVGTGTVYVVFGSPALAPEIDVLASPNVLRIAGATGGDHFGVWVDVVDVDGDGFGDVLVGAPDVDGPAGDRESAGAAYVLYGGGDLVPGTTSVGALDAAGRVFTVHGADSQDKAGSAVHAGRIDADGVADLVVGSALNRAAVVVFNGSVEGADGPDETRARAGEVAVVFTPTRGGSVDLADPPADAAIVYGADPGDFAGEEVNVGDADGDGFGDVLIGALTADGFENLRNSAGEAYLVYGGPALHGARIDLRQPPAGVSVIYGPTAGGITGDTARFIDIDGDGRDDVFIGSPTGTFLGSDARERTGALFFVRSPAGRLPAEIQLDHPPLATLPFGVVLAADPGDILSYSLIGADVDQDGAGDVVVNAMIGDGRGNLFLDAGEAYVISGAALSAAAAPFATGDLDGDGRSDAADLQRALGVLAGRGSLSDSETRAADVNGNGQLDVGDLVGLVDRVLDRNLLAPGALGRSSLSKQAQIPEYRYDEPDGHGGYDAAFRLVEAPGAGAMPGGRRRAASDGSAAPGPDLALGALEVTFRLPAGLATPPRLVSSAGQVVTAGVRGGRFRVLVLAGANLPLGVPLFRFAGTAPRLEGVTAATRGGSLRPLASASAVAALGAGAPALGRPAR